MFELSARSGLLYRGRCGAELELPHTELVRLHRLNTQEELGHVVEHPPRERIVVFTLETQPRYNLLQPSRVSTTLHTSRPFSGGLLRMQGKCAGFLGHTRNH